MIKKAKNKYVFLFSFLVVVYCFILTPKAAAFFEFNLNDNGGFLSLDSVKDFLSENLESLNQIDYEGWVEVPARQAAKKAITITRDGKSSAAFSLASVFSSVKDTVVKIPQGIMDYIFPLRNFNDFADSALVNQNGANDSVGTALNQDEFKKIIQEQKRETENALSVVKSIEQKYNNLQREIRNIKDGGLKITGPIIEKKTIEKTLEKTISGLPAYSAGISQDKLDSGISALKTELNNINTNLINQINNLSSQTGRQNSATFQAIALTNRIDNLSGTKLSSITVSGVSGLTDADIPDTLTASLYLPLTGGTLTGNLTISGTATSSFAGDTNFDSGVLYVDSINNRVGVGTTSPSDTLSLNGAAYLSQISAPSVTTDRLYNTSGDLYWNSNLIGSASVGNWTLSGGNVYRSSGKVGIGTTSPGAKLEIYGPDSSLTSSAGLRFTLESGKFGDLVDVASSATSSPVMWTDNLYGRLKIGSPRDVSGQVLSLEVGTYGTTGNEFYMYDRNAFRKFMRYLTDDGNLSLQPTAGNVGIGTSTPSTKLSVGGAAGDTTGHGYFTGGLGIGMLNTTAGTLNVLGQCVTGDTLLRRRRRRKNGETDEDLEKSGALSWDNEFVYDEIEIINIKKGDEVASLDQETGVFAWSRVNGLLDTGIQPLLRITTLSGRTIRTTANHPYFVRAGEYKIKKDDKKQKLYRFEVDLSMKIEQYGVDTVVAIANAEQSYTLAIPNKVKQQLRDNLRSKFPREFQPAMYAVAIVEALKRMNTRIHELIIDTDYPSHEDVIVRTINASFPSIEISFAQVGKKSLAHFACYGVHKKQKNADYAATIKDMNGQTKNALPVSFLAHKGASSENHQAFFNTNSLCDGDTFVKRGKWAPSSGLKVGQQIAVAHGDTPAWERIVAIKAIPQEQVYDIEIDGTHNFIGNNIVAHNTYIGGNVGIGTTSPFRKLSVAGRGWFDDDVTSGYFTATSTTATSTFAGGLAVETSGLVYDYSTNRVGIGTTAPAEQLQITGNFRLPSSTATAGIVYSGADRFIHNYGTNNLFAGKNSGNFTLTGVRNVVLGDNSLNNLTTGNDNNAIGVAVLGSLTTGINNMAMGGSALNLLTTGNYNTAIGVASLALLTTGSGNTGIGSGSLLLDTGSNNTALGYSAGDNITTGSNNLIIGYDIDAPSATLSNQLNIGNLIFSKGIDGTGTTLSTGNIGIGTTSPSTKLSVGGAAGDTTGHGYFTGGLGIGMLNTTAGTLNVLGQCVTGDTKLRRRRRKKSVGKRSALLGDSRADLEETDFDDDYIYDEVAIKDIVAGDEIASLNEQTGKIVWSKVNALMDMGVKPIYKIAAASGKTIRTTGNHPYLVKEIGKRQVKHQSPIKNAGWIAAENIKEGDYIAVSKPKVGVFIDDANMFYAQKKAGWRVDYNKLKAFLGEVFDIRFMNYYLTIPNVQDSAYLKTQKYLEELKERYGGSLTIKSKPLKYIFDGEEKKRVKKGNVDGMIAVDLLSYFDELDTVIVLSGDSDYLDLIPPLLKKGKKVLFMGFEDNMAWELRQRQHIYFDRIQDLVDSKNKNAPEFETGVPLLLPVYSSRNFLSSPLIVDKEKGFIWARINSTENLPDEQVYDIEIEGTRNFIGNDIIAHNTYLGGNVGIGTTSPFRKLSVAGRGWFDDDVTSGYFTATSTTATSTFAGGLAFIGESNAYISFPRTGDTTRGLVISNQYTPSDNKSVIRGSGSVTENISIQPGLGTGGVRGEVHLQQNGGGKVSINNYVPMYNLDVTGDGRFTSFVDASNFTATSTTATSTFAGGVSFGKDLAFTNTATSSVTMANGLNFDNNTFVIDPNSGFVGVGTTSPAYKLDVNGGSGLASRFTRTSSGSSVNVISLQVLSSTGVGDTDLGASLQYQIQNSVGSLTEATVIRGLWNDATSASEDSSIAFLTRLNGTVAEKVRIDNNGNLGIGTTSPSTKLSVGGAAGDTTGHGYFTGGLGVGILNTTANTFRVGQCVTGDTKLRRRRRRKNQFPNPKFQTNLNDQNSKLENCEIENSLKIENCKLEIDDDYIYDEVAIKDIVAGDEIASLDEKTGKIVWSKVKQLAYMGKKQTFKLATEDGRQIRATANHPYLAEQGWTKVSDLRVGMPIAVPRARGKRVYSFIDLSNVYHGAREGGWEMDYGALYRYLTTRYGSSKVFIFGGASDKPERIRQYENFSHIGYEVLLVPTRKRDDGSGKADVDSRMTFEMMRLKDEYDRAVVITGDGDFYWVLEYLKAIKERLWLFGMSKRTAHSLKGLFGDDFTDLTTLRRALSLKTQKAESVKISASAAMDTFDGYIAGINTSYARSNEKSSAAVDNPEAEPVRYGASSMAWVKIRSIEPIAEEDVYDVEIENTHNFIGNDIVAHNTAFMVDSTGNIGIGTTSPYAKLSVEGSSALGNSALAGYFTATSSTASVFPYASTTAMSASGPAYAANFVASSASATSTFAGGLAVETSGLVYDYSTNRVGIGTAAPNRTFKIETGNTKISGADGVNGFEVMTGVNGGVLIGGDYYHPIIQGMDSNGVSAREILINREGGNVGIGVFATEAINNLLTVKGAVSIGTNYNTVAPANGLIIEGNIGIGTTSPYAKLSVEGSSALGNSALAGYFTATTSTASVFPYASTTALTVSGNSYLGTVSSGLWNGTLIGVPYGGTGWAAIQSGTIPYGNGASALSTTTAGTAGNVLAFLNGIPTWTATSTLSEITGNLSVAKGGTGASTFLQGWLHSSGGTNAITSSTSPTVNYLTATSTTATSTFAGGLAVETSGLVYDYSTGYVGIGTASPNQQLEITGNFRLPTSTTTAGIIYSGADRYIHNFGTNNFFAGVNAGNLTTSGTGGNNAVGYQALTALTTGHSNNAFGYQALFQNTTGERNNAFGLQSLYSNTTGTDNLALGQGALGTNVSGIQNTAVGGNDAMSYILGSNNVAVGYGAGRGPTGSGISSSQNTLIGSFAGFVLNTGSGNNTMLGYRTGFANTSGANNIFLGYQAGDNITTGSNNLIIGYDIDAPSATLSNQLNIGNLIFSQGIDGTGTTLSTGNIGIGTTSPYAKLSVHGLATDSDTSKPLFLVASSTASATTTHFIITNTGKVGIGTAAPAYPLDVLGAGTGAIIARFNDVNSTGCTLATGGTISCSSDISLKKNIEDIGDGLNKVLDLHPILFNWKAENDSSSDLKNLGFIAQEVELILPKLVSSEDGGTKQLNTIGMIPVLTKAIQEQQEMIEGLKQAMASTTDLIASLSAGTSGVQSSSGVISQSFAWILNQFKISGVVFEYDALKVKNVEAEKVKTKEICVGNTCVTEDQFKAFFGSSVASSSSGQASSATDVSSPSSSSSPAEATSSSSSNSFSSESSTDTSNSSATSEVSSSQSSGG